MRLDLALRRLVKPERQRRISDLMILFLEDAVIARLGPQYGRTTPKPKAKDP
jgi:hypothetical protein